MMNLRLKKILTITLFAFLIVCFAGLALSQNFRNVGAGQLKLQTEISESYNLGDSFTPPSARINYGGVDYDAIVGSVTFPDGKSYKSSEYLLSYPGEYSVNYKAKVGDNVVSSSVKFSVYANAYSVTTSNSSAYYGSINNTDAFGEPILNEGTPVTTSGIIVSLASGDTFTYKKPIDLNGKTKLDNIISLYSLPAILGKADARILKVRLTDAYDPNNYVDIVTYGNYGDEDENKGWALYSAAGANGQPLTGIHFYAASNERTFIYQGQLYTLNKNVAYNSANGYPSFEYSLAAKKGYGQGEYTLSMNYAEKQLFGCKTIAPSSNGMICDLDEPLFFDNLWNGFTTGEVYVSVSAENYVGATFSFIVTDILGEDLSENTFTDRVAPRIKVDTPSSIPSAIVEKPYKVFSATSTDDVDGNVDTNVIVYRNYYSSNPVMVNVQDGEFIPNEEGVYTIIYSATDKAGQEGKVKVDVTAKAQSDLAIDYTIDETEFKAGRFIEIAKPTIIGNDGDYKLTVTITVDGKPIEVMPNEDGDYEYLAMKAGGYTVKYHCADYNTFVESSYDVTVVANANPVFITGANLPPVFVNQVSYVLKTRVGYDFSSGLPVKKVADIYYSFDGGEYQKYTDGESLKITATSIVKIKYSLGTELESNEEYEIDVADVGRINNKYIVKEYFYGKNFDKVATSKDVTYISVDEDASLTFVNKLLVTSFGLKYKINEFEGEKITFTFTDVEDPSVAFNLAVRPKDDFSYYISVNGEKESVINKSLFENSQLTYDDEKRTVTFGGVAFEIKNFNGFISKLAWLEIDFEENEYISFSVSEINGQPVESSESDSAPPIYTLIANLDQKKLNDKLVISGLYAQDVLKFTTTCKLSVRDENGYAVSEDGVVMKDVTDFSRPYVIELNVLGLYRITGQVTDGVKKANIGGQVEVKSSLAPTIELKGVKTTASVGQVTVAKCSVTSSEDVTVTVCVQRPDLSVVNVSNYRFNAKTKGVYTVMYYVTDQSGNVAFESYEIVVK